MMFGTHSPRRYRRAVALALLCLVAGAAPQARGAEMSAPIRPATAAEICRPQLARTGGSPSAPAKACPADQQTPTAMPATSGAGIIPLQQRVPGEGSAAASLAERAPAESMSARPADLPSLATPASARTCSKTTIAWSTASELFELVTTCTITIPITGTVYLNASASVGLASNAGQAYLARFQIGVDNARLPSSDRYVEINADSGDGTDENLASQAVVTLGPGEHTISLFSALAAGAGPVQLYRATITAIYAPVGGDMRICGSPELASWQPSGPEPFQPIASCALTLPITGTVFLSASTAQSVAISGQAYTGQYSLRVDNSPKDYSYVDVYPGVGSGTNRTVALQAGVSVGPGARTFSLLGGIYDGSGPMQIAQPSIAAIYLPHPLGSSAAGCTAANGSWTTISGTLQPATSCTLTVPVTTTIFLNATTTAFMSQNGQPYEAELMLGIDGLYHDASKRWINIYADSRDGTDKTVATQMILVVNPGTHTFQFGARKYGGTGPVALFNSMVSATVLGSGETRLSAIPDQQVYLGQTVGPLPVTIETIIGSLADLPFGGGSYNPDLITSVSASGAGANRSLTFTVNPTKIGTATIVYGTSDGSREVRKTFRVTIRYGLMLPIARR